jgi:hypothetical protein
MSRKLTSAGLVCIVLVAGLWVAIFAQQMGKMEPGKLSPALEKRLDDVRKELTAVKGDMPGLACCIGPACNFCPLVAGKCPCGMNVRSVSGVCGECYDGWHAGQGRMPGVKAGDVKHWNAAMLDSMFKARVQLFSKAPAKPAAPKK